MEGASEAELRGKSFLCTKQSVALIWNVSHTSENRTTHV